MTEVRYHGLLAALSALLLTGCLNMDEPRSRPQVEIPAATLVGDVSLSVSQSIPEESRLLDVGVRVFTPGAVDPETAQVNAWLVEEIRKKEAHYLPFVLKNTLLDSNQWGAVRVLPDEDPSVDLQISGTVLHSDGLNLILRIEARDSTGRQWLNRVYSDESGASDYQNRQSVPGARITEAIDPFQDLYDRIANDLVEVRDSFSPAELTEIGRVSQLVYAQDLAPSSFSGTLTEDAEGLLTVSRLLAEDDPMLRRVGDMRVRHHLFIDRVDEYYASLHDEMRPLYNLWRSYSREQILETRERVLTSVGGSSNILELTQSYDRFKWARIYEQEFQGLAQGFNNEVAPAILELNRRVYGLSGTLEEQYVEWREILRQLFEVETGELPPLESD